MDSPMSSFGTEVCNAAKSSGRGRICADPRQALVPPSSVRDVQRGVGVAVPRDFRSRLDRLVAAAGAAELLHQLGAGHRQRVAVATAAQLGQEVRVVDRRRPLLPLRGGVFRADAVDFRGADFRSVDFLGAPVPVVSDLSDVAGLSTGWPYRLLNWWTTSAVPADGQQKRPFNHAGSSDPPEGSRCRRSRMAAVGDAVADSGHGALEATDRTADCRATDGARRRSRRIGCPGYNARGTSHDVHHALPAITVHQPVSRPATNQATRVLTVLTCGISVARGFRTAAARRD
jgi:hypothetical protein